MKKIDDNYLTIHGWMVSKLGLKGNELLAFALIFGFSQDGETEFKGSLKYISTWLNCSKSTTIRTIDALVEKELIVKRQEIINDVAFNRYSINESGMNRVVSKCDQGGVKMKPGGGVKMKPNNINIDNNKDIDNNKAPNGALDFSPEEIIELERQAENPVEPIHLSQPEKEKKKVAPKKKRKAADEIPVEMFGVFDDPEMAQTHWLTWEQYKKNEHRKTYKTAESRQIAVNQLQKLSRGKAETALQIINQSRANLWAGLFELKNTQTTAAGRNPAKIINADKYAKYAGK